MPNTALPVVGALILLAANLPAHAQQDVAQPGPPHLVSTAPPPTAPPAASNLPLNLGPSLDFSYPHFSGSLEDATAYGDADDPVKLVYGGEFSIQAQKLTGDLIHQKFSAEGDVRAQELDAFISAESLYFQGSQKLGLAHDAMLYEYPLRLRAQTIDVTPNALVASRSDVATVPPGSPTDLEIRAGQIVLFPERRRVVLRNMSLYLLHNRLFTVRYFAYKISKQTNHQTQYPLRPGFGVSSRYGTFVSFAGQLNAPGLINYNVLLPTRQSPAVQLTSEQVLAPAPPNPNAKARLGGAAPSPLETLRAAAELLEPLLPQGDPLLFHDIIPIGTAISLSSLNPNRLTTSENVSANVNTYGNQQSNLYVSRLPEASVAGAVPITRTAVQPTDRNPAEFRRYLRHITLWAEAQETLGNYQEQPTDVRASREQFVGRLTTNPILVGPNTLFLPIISVTDNRYSGSESHFGYEQIDASLNHYYTEQSAVGVRYLFSNVHGSSPFNFDIPDTTRELDGFVQSGSRHLIVGTAIRYDLVRRNIFDYDFTLAPVLHGFAPVFTYSLRSRGVSLGLVIPGLNF